MRAAAPRRLYPLAFVLVAASGSALADPSPGVVAVRATRVDFPVRVQALGTARANEFVEIRPKISERVVTIRFVEGQEVATGEVLVELEDADARAAVESAKAALVDSQSKQERALELFRSSLIAASDLESSRARRDSDKAAVDAAEARLAETIIRAPFAGRVGLRRVSVGALVGPDTVITTLDDTATIKVDFDIPETALALAHEGLPIVAHSAAWPNQDFSGQVETIDTRVDPATRMITVRASVPNEERKLRPGMFLSVDIVHEDVAALMVPEHALITEQSAHYLFVVGEDGVVEKREIRIGRRRPGQVEIAAGLAHGEIVIVEGTQKAQPGKRVEVLETLSSSP